MNLKNIKEGMKYLILVQSQYYSDGGWPGNSSAYDYLETRFFKTPEQVKSEIEILNKENKKFKLFEITEKKVSTEIKVDF